MQQEKEWEFVLGGGGTRRRAFLFFLFSISSGERFLDGRLYEAGDVTFHKTMHSNSNNISNHGLVRK